MLLFRPAQTPRVPKHELLARFTALTTRRRRSPTTNPREPPDGLWTNRPHARAATADEGTLVRARCGAGVYPLGPGADPLRARRRLVGGQMDQASLGHGACMPGRQQAKAGRLLAAATNPPWQGLTVRQQRLAVPRGAPPTKRGGRTQADPQLTACSLAGQRHRQL